MTEPNGDRRAIPKATIPHGEPGKVRQPAGDATAVTGAASSPSSSVGRLAKRGLRLVILGRQGAGKGTQSELIAEALGILHLSTGDLLRDAVRHDTPLGRRVQRHLDRGELVSDDVMVQVVSNRLLRLNGHGFLLDGFPRTVAQAEALLDATSIDAAISLDVPTEVVLRRLATRRVCGSCGWTTTVADMVIDSIPCGRCDDVAIRRSDDHEDAIRRRLALYDEQTGPLTPWFAQRSVLVSIDGLGATNEVFNRIISGLAGVPGIASKMGDVGPIDDHIDPLDAEPVPG